MSQPHFGIRSVAVLSLACCVTATVEAEPVDKGTRLSKAGAEEISILIVNDSDRHLTVKLDDRNAGPAGIIERTLAPRSTTLVRCKPAQYFLHRKISGEFTRGSLMKFEKSGVLAFETITDKRGDLEGLKRKWLTTELLREQSSALIGQQNYQGALKVLNLAIAVESRDYLAYNERGVAYTWLDKDAEAIRDFTRAIELNAKAFMTYRNRGAAYLRQSKLDEALADFNKAIALNAKYARAYQGRGDVYKKLGKLKEAEADYKTARQLEPAKK
jgi:hypothetical protein